MNPTTGGWRKSSHSGGTGANGDCVEVAVSPRQVGLRDSKNPCDGVLYFPVGSWRIFVVRVQVICP
ncbi:DUF397 domain-containing protein [Amycolatopsis minnesotensis]|uniref:DUF397 domain-containing protein n=1 Tax=Amycolatopsis minnesotensis TaxID=337894 RepID=UPI0031D66C23